MDINIVRDYLIEKLNFIKQEIKDKPYPFQVMKVNVDGSGHSEPMLPIGLLEVFGTIALNKDNENELLVRFLFGYLAKAKTLEYLDNAFNELFEELAYFEKTGNYIFRTIGFISPIKLGNNIGIEPGLSLISPSNEYLNFFYNVWYDPKPGFKDLMSISKLVLFQSCFYFENLQYEKVIKDLVPISPKIDKLIQAILLNTSLTKSIHVSTVYTFSYLYNYGAPFKMNYYDRPESLFDLRSFSIDEEALLNTYKSVEKCNDGSIYLALRRLTYLRNKQCLEDKFLDLMIILEGLFPKIQDELKFRLSICVGALLNSKKDSDHLKIMYDLRSSIAHGSEVSEKKLKKLGGDLETSCLLLDEMVRKSILKCIDFIEDGRSLDDLEDYILKKLYS